MIPPTVRPCGLAASSHLTTLGSLTTLRSAAALLPFLPGWFVWPLCRALALAFALPAVAQVPGTLLHSIPAPPVGVQADAQLGWSVAVEGGFTVVGAFFDDAGGLNSGVVKVFDSMTGALLFLIPNPSPTANDRFGISVAISGTRVVVGASGNANSTGSAYVYDLSSGTPTAPLATLNNPGPATADQFGHSVAISGTRVVVGVPFDDTGASDAGSAYVYDLSSGTPTVPLATLNNPGPAAGDEFGRSVGISGTRVVVGAHFDDTGASNAGSAYVYVLTGGTPTVPVATLNNPGPAAGDEFGHSVGISGTRVVVGAHYDDTGASNAGSAYVYDVSSGTPTVPIATLNNPSSQAAFDLFGYSVAISGTRVVVGAPYDNPGAADAGSTYVYDLSSGTPTVPVATLNNPSPVELDTFGTSVAISSTRVVVGAPADDTGASNAGSAYVYDVSSGTPTVPVAALNDPGLSVSDTFGTSVAVSGTLMVVGSPYDVPGATDAGSAYVYDLSSGTPTVPVATLNNPDPAAGDSFGYSVAISSTRVVVGVPSDSTGASFTGSVYVYDLTSGTPTMPVATLNNPGPAPGDSFGTSVAISGMLMVIGTPRDDTGAADAGSAYVYDLSSGTPTVPVATLNNPSPAAQDYFGTAVAISGTRVVVGAYLDDTGAFNAGSAYVYDLSSGTPTVPVATLSNPSPAAIDAFGTSVAISGTRVVVGAPFDNTGATAAGSAYVYDLSSGTPTVPVATLNNPGPTADDNFGNSVTVSGTRVLVGAYFDDTGASNVGSAYVYDLSSGTPTVPVATLNNPGPAADDNFGTSVAIDGTTFAIGTPGDDTTAFDKGAAYVFTLLPDTTTLAPTLTAPASSSAVGGMVAVDFTLPEAALSGSVTLTFTGGVTRQLVLAASQEGAGNHQFGFPVANPTAAAQVASGAAIPDGVYAVTLSYRDALGNAAATAMSSNVVVDTTTLAPALTAPASSSMVGGVVAVDFTLPEAALSGSVTLTFTGGVTRQLVLAASQEGAGNHQFGFPVANPTAAAQVASGAAIPDGVYAVTLSYRDALGNAAATAMSSNVVVDTTTLAPALTAPASSSTVGGMIGVAFTLPEAALAGSVTLSFGATVLTLAVSQETSGSHAFTFTATNPTANPEIASGSAITDGTYTVTLSYQDALGNPAATAVSSNVAVVTPPPDQPDPVVIVGTDGAATGAGLPTGTTFETFTAPDVGIFGGQVRTPAGQMLDAVFQEDGEVMLRGQQMVDVAPGGGAMGMIAELNPPTGDAVLATLDRAAGGATAENDQVLFGGLEDGAPVARVRKGQEIPGLPGVFLKSFITVDGNGSVAFFLGKLKGVGVTPKNDVGLFAAGAAPVGFRLLVRKGQTAGVKTVKTVATLVGIAATLAEGRWRSGDDQIGVRLTFDDKSQGLYLVRATDLTPADWLVVAQSGDTAGPDLPAATIQSLNFPAYGPTGLVFDALLVKGAGGITKKNDLALFDALGVDTRGPIVLDLLGQRAGPVPGPFGGLEDGSTLLDSRSVLAGLGRARSFIGSVKLPGGKKPTDTIFDATADGVLKRVARKGEDAPDGGKFEKFLSVAKPDGDDRGVLISALLKVDKDAGVTKSNRGGLYAGDRLGVLRRLFRTGDMLPTGPGGTLPKRVKKFTALTAAAGSIGAARGYDGDGRLSVLVTFDDNTQSVLRLQLP